MSTSAKGAHIEALLDFASLLLINQAASADHPLIAAHKDMVRTAYALPDLAPAGAPIKIEIDSTQVRETLALLEQVFAASECAIAALGRVGQATPAPAICTGVVELIPGQQVFADPNADALRDILVNAISESAKCDSVTDIAENAAKALKAGLAAFAAPAIPSAAPTSATGAPSNADKDPFAPTFEVSECDGGFAAKINVRVGTVAYLVNATGPRSSAVRISAGQLSHVLVAPVLEIPL
jgi:hypothetical protein